MAIVTFYRGDPKNAPKPTMPAHLGANAIIPCGGRLLLDSKEGQGTTVTLALPDETAGDVVEDVTFDYAGGFQPALVGLADGLPFEAFLQRHSDE